MPYSAMMHRLHLMLEKSSRQQNFTTMKTNTSQALLRLFIPARITDAQSDMLRETAVKAYKALGCKGLSRVDFFLQKDGGIILNEINTLPGFTNISMYPKLMEHLGMSQEYLVDKLIEQAMENAERMY